MPICLFDLFRTYGYCRALVVMECPKEEENCNLTKNLHRDIDSLRQPGNHVDTAPDVDAIAVPVNQPMSGSNYISYFQDFCMFSKVFLHYRFTVYPVHLFGFWNIYPEALKRYEHLSKTKPTIMLAEKSTQPKTGKLPGGDKPTGTDQDQGNSEVLTKSSLKPAAHQYLQWYGPQPTELLVLVLLLLLPSVNALDYNDDASNNHIFGAQIAFVLLGIGPLCIGSLRIASGLLLHYISIVMGFFKKTGGTVVGASMGLCSVIWISLRNETDFQREAC
ncbi:uncharacterized protein K452DRAFT_341295 [Aplosporella prunicola CBS 121167]|uniref:Uncharacterized protein n=1 Tax=Aplosporella prunicola CBS 121167 TaxID=1176127 RepID=A0A6A6B3K9_9PEZI|nr:uncharacterized protein K452DRAFT_341295 [Aplosporella prunicola CBS 121167]KAF2137311.1 hypothetical protein K452DRAFT_341295 [Aplosporella prunicola CBS 121167]